MFSLLSVAFAASIHVPVHGALTDGAGAPLTGTHELTFRVYHNGAIAPANLLHEEAIPVTLVAGAFAADLGGTVTFDGTDLNGATGVLLTVAVDGGAPSDPVSVGRVMLAAAADWAATADAANEALALQGHPAADFALASDARLTNARPPTGAAGGDLSGSFPNPAVVALRGRALSDVAPVDGQALVWSAAASAWVPGTVASGGGGGGTTGDALTITAPDASLVLAGSARLGGDSRACTSGIEGTLRWNTTLKVFEGCIGTQWKQLLASGPNSQSTPHRSCAALKSAIPSSADGPYWIDTTPATAGDAVQVWCDMTYDGGGWTTITNTLRPNATESAVALTTPVADLAAYNPSSRNLGIWKWTGDTWSEFLVECRATAGSTPARWIFSRGAQTSAVQSGIDAIITLGINNHSSFGTGGNNVCTTKYGGTVYCGHNNGGTEGSWNDGFQIGTTNPVWNGLLFAATDAQPHFKCHQTVANSYTSSGGDVGPDAIYTYRVR